MATCKTAGEPIRHKINQYRDDPIQNRSLSDSCWNGDHISQPKACNGWKDECDHCTKKQRHKRDCGCGCHGRCECHCHDPQERRPKVSKKQQATATMHILDSGCGTIEIKG